MKKKHTEKKSLKKQLLSGVIYTALSAIVVAVTVNTTVGIISGKNDLGDISGQLENIKVEIPSVPDIPKTSIPQISFDDSIPKAPAVPEQEHIVSDTQEGIDSFIVEDNYAATTEKEISDTAEAVTEPSVTQDLLTIPEDADLGFDTFIKPCSGYVSKEHSIEIPVYSSTMSDYRTHTGIDVVSDLGTTINVVSGGVVTDIYDDDMFGKTVCMKNRNGYIIKYSNLLPELYANVEIGAVLATGAPLGGIGKTALCEAVEAPHVHLEIYDPCGNAVDPEELICF